MTARVAAIETVRHPAHRNVVQVLLHADDGAAGLGETFLRADSVAAHVHAAIAPALLGAPAGNLAELWRRVGLWCDGSRPWSGAVSVDSSATSAIDMAMWDLRARRLGVPLHEALGGAVREAIRVYVTCVDPGQDESWELGVPGGSAYHDWTASLERPAELARELVAAGFTAVKTYPFTRLDGGLSITPEQLEQNVALVRALRAPGLDVAVDLANQWSLAPARQIVRALDELGLLWIEDPLALAATGSLARLAALARTPIAASDYRAGLASYLDLIEAGATDIVRMDLQWVGGLTEALRIAAVAGARGLGVVLHDCAGPVGWAAAVHAAVHLPEAMVQEMARPYVFDAYPAMVTAVPQVRDGHASTPPGPGLGLDLRPDFLAAAERRRTTLRGGRPVTEVVS